MIVICWWFHRYHYASILHCLKDCDFLKALTKIHERTSNVREWLQVSYDLWRKISGNKQKWFIFVSFRIVLTIFKDITIFWVVWERASSSDSSKYYHRLSYLCIPNFSSLHHRLERCSHESITFKPSTRRDEHAFRIELLLLQRR